MPKNAVIVTPQNSSSVIMKTSFILGGIVLVSVGAYWLFTKLAAPKTANGKKVFTPSVKDIVKDATIAVKPKTSNNFPLKNGSKNDLVKALQSALNRLGASPTLAVDGIFGSKTQAALVAQTGKSSVDSQSELDSLINQGSAAATGGQVLIYNPDQSCKYAGTWDINKPFGV